jgi:hypothetical protein
MIKLYTVITDKNEVAELCKGKQEADWISWATSLANVKIPTEGFVVCFIFDEVPPGLKFRSIEESAYPMFRISRNFFNNILFNWVEETEVTIYAI